MPKKHVTWDPIKKLLWLLPVMPAAVLAAFFALRRYAVPAWVTWGQRELTWGFEDSAADDGEARDQDIFAGPVTLRISHGRAVLQGVSGEKLFSSDKGMRVQDGLFADLDRDGVPEMVLLVWRRGQYGSHRPYWVTEEERGFVQHLYVYRFDRSGRPVPMWFSSDTGMELTSLRTHEKNASLLVLEDVSGAVTVWRWTDFGPELAEQGEPAE
ncbi:MAG: hypothetical protein IKS07_01690 [Lachnospiraceae bacterium]|nr:hypothetical protein [Lachnospiraceae bacterium]